MSNYKKASKLKLRFATPKGSLSVEQLWDLSQENLEKSIRAVNEDISEADADDLDFLSSDNNGVDEETQLRFDILKDVYITRKEEAKKAREKAKAKAQKQRLVEIKAMKEEENLKDLSVEELEERIQEIEA